MIADVRCVDGAKTTTAKYVAACIGFPIYPHMALPCNQHHRTDGLTFTPRPPQNTTAPTHSDLIPAFCNDVVLKMKTRRRLEIVGAVPALSSDGF